MADPFTSLGVFFLGAAAKAVVAYANAKFQLWQGCEDDARMLVKRQGTIRAHLEDAANSRQGFAAGLIEKLLDQLKEVDDDTEDLLSTIATDEARWRINKVRKLPLKLSTGNASEIKDLLTRIDDIYADLALLRPNVGESSGGHPAYYKFSSDHPDTINKIIGREGDIDKVVGMVLAEREPPIMVSITGERGVGKTTLAQEVFNHQPCIQGPEEEEEFAFKIWISVAHELDYKAIMKEILRNGSRVRNCDMNNLSEHQLEKLVIGFLNSYDFLLVLDGVGVDACGSLLKLTDLIISKGWKGTILVTSRSGTGQSVEELMKIKNTHLLNPLDENNSWELFKQPMGQENLGIHFINVGKSIVGCCNGLPLLVKVVGGLLSCFDDLEKWKEINRKCREGVNSRIPCVQRTLDICSSHLPPHLKKCFAYCQIFPKAHPFDRTELLKLWESSSLIHPDLSGLTIDEIAKSHFDQLLRMSFFQQHKTGEEKQQLFEMLDLTQKSPQTLSKSYFCKVKDTRENRTYVGSRYASLLCEDVEGASSKIIKNSKKLRALLLPRQDHKPFGKSSLEGLFLNQKCMRTLDLSWNALVELPGSVSELKLLRYLDLSNNDMKELPNSICSLLNLQTLKLLGCPWLLQLPKDLSNLTNLENLELDDDTFWSKSPSLPIYMGKLVKLKNLHAYQIRRKSGCRVDELGGLACLTGTLHISKLENAVRTPGQAHLINKEKVNELVLEWSDAKEDGCLSYDLQHRYLFPIKEDKAAEGVLTSLQPHSNLQVLKIICYRGSCSPSPYESWMREGFLTNLVTLSLNKCSKCKKLSLGKQVEKLKELEIVGMSELEEWADQRHYNLERLTISHCPKLTKLPSCDFEAMSFLKVENCALLVTLVDSSYIGSLVLVNNPVLEVVPRHPTENILDGRSEIKIINCPELRVLELRFPPRKLELSGCHIELPGSLLTPEVSDDLEHLSLDGFHVEQLWAIPDTSILYYLVISNISGLARLPTFPVLRSLEALYIHHCPDLVSISDEQDSPFPELPSLQILSLWDNAQLERLPGLPASITYLSIGKCPRLSSLGKTLSGLTALKDLRLTACPSLQSLPQGRLPVSLVHLHIEGCPELSDQCRENGGSEWEKIEHIPDREIVYAMEDPEESSPSSKPFYRRSICCTGTSTR